MFLVRLIVGVPVVVLFLAGAQVASAQPPVARPQPPPPVAGAKPAQPATPPPAQTSPAPAVTSAEAAPTAATLGMPVFPTAQYLGSYDAGRGQRFYLFGARQSFAELVAYYRTVLANKGELVFEEPPTHTFDVGKYKDTEVAFPPGVTIKDYMWGGGIGFANSKPGASPASFPTVIQIVAAPGRVASPPR